MSEQELIQYIIEKIMTIIPRAQAIKSQNGEMWTDVISLLVGREAEVVLPKAKYFPIWKEGSWNIGENCMYLGYPYKVIQNHNSTGNPTWTPFDAPALFAPWHGVSVDTALPWKQPTGAQDIYLVDEYIVFTDGKTYRCLINTNYSPTEYAQAWQEII